MCPENVLSILQQSKETGNINIPMDICHPQLGKLRFDNTKSLPLGQHSLGAAKQSFKPMSLWIQTMQYLTIVLYLVVC